MCSVIMSDRISSSEIAERVDVESIEEWSRSGQPLRWFQHVLGRDRDTEEGRILTMEVAGAGRWEREARQQKDMVEKDTRLMGFEKGMTSDRET